MKRIVLAIIAGYAAWTVLWLAGGLSLMAVCTIDPTAERIDNTIYLGLALGLSVACSLVGGFTCGAIARCKTSAGWILGTLLLLTGVVVQGSAWSSMPLWYHLPFLVLLEPMAMVGFWFACRKAPARRQ